MALIRECQPNKIEEWEQWYFENATTAGKYFQNNKRKFRGTWRKVVRKNHRSYS